MSTTVRIARKDKERLDQLRRYLSFHARRKITQEDVMESLIDAAEASKEELAKKLSSTGEATTGIDASDPFFHLPSINLGKTASKDHDKLIYGGG